MNKTKYTAFLLSCLRTENQTDAQSVLKAFNQFVSEYRVMQDGYIEDYTRVQTAVAEWLQGVVLPIPFENYKIAQALKEHKILRSNASEAAIEYEIYNNYYNWMARALLSLNRTLNGRFNARVSRENASYRIDYGFFKNDVQIVDGFAIVQGLARAQELINIIKQNASDSGASCAISGAHDGNIVSGTAEFMASRYADKMAMQTDTLRAIDITYMSFNGTFDFFGDITKRNKVTRIIDLPAHVLQHEYAATLDAYTMQKFNALVLKHARGESKALTPVVLATTLSAFLAEKPANYSGRYGTIKALKEWLQGMPSALELPFERGEIVAIMGNDSDDIFETYYMECAAALYNLGKVFNKGGF